MDAFGPLNISAEALAEEAAKFQRKLEAILILHPSSRDSARMAPGFRRDDDTG